MTTTTPEEVQKEDSMLKQKAMINANYHALANAPKSGAKVASTFVPGNLNELLMCFDFVRNLPDGRVQLVAEGKEQELDRFLEAIADTMSGFIRDQREDKRGATGEFVGFQIRY